MRVLAPLLLIALAGAARADELSEARQLFQRGVELVKKAQWFDALDAFERSSTLHAHPITTYNMALCERALGHSTRARQLFGRALAGEKDLAPSLVNEAKGFAAELERTLVRIDLALVPDDAAVAIDGRPLVLEGNGTAVAGLAEPGPGKPLGQKQIAVALDPGTHVFLLSKTGFADAVWKQTFTAGQKETIKLELAKLPGRLVVNSNQPGAVVAVDGLDVGGAPVELSRPAGLHEVVVRKRGHNDYRTRVNLSAGQPLELQANLQKRALVKQWWFWTPIVVATAGIVVGVYFGARGENQRPDGGGLQWVADVR